MSIRVRLDRQRQLYLTFIVVPFLSERGVGKEDIGSGDEGGGKRKRGERDLPIIVNHKST